LVRIFDVLGKGEEFLGVLFEHKFFPEFISLRQLKKTSLGPIRYYFESLQDFIVRRLDTMIKMFGEQK
jgi:hypothetical protein